MSVHKFIGPSVLLFLDQTLVAAANWIYWLIISKFSSTSEIGQATTVYSLVLLATTLTQLGLEYPLLKKSSIYTHKSKILGTTLVIELALTLASVPIVIYVINNLYQHSLQGFSGIAVMLLIFSSVGFVARFGLLGISDAKNVLLFDVAGVGIKFAAGYALVAVGFGTFGILISFLLQAVLICGGTLVIVVRTLPFRMGDIKYIKETIRDGLINTPSKLSKMLILSLSVVLLASFGINGSEIGLYYVALMISIVVGSLASSMAYMVIPASSASNADLSSGSIRISLSLTAPLIAILISSPKYILHIIGAQYVPAETVLLILSIAIVPSIIVVTAISKFNNLNNSKKLLSIGSIQTLVFLVSFFLLVHSYGTLGAAFSILIAFVAASIPSLIWSDRSSIRYVANSCVAIIAGAVAGYLIHNISPLAGIITSIGVAFMIVIVLKNTSAKEMRQLITTMIKGK
jgi:O-antigen/teichoic acid export membrane protein